MLSKLFHFMKGKTTLSLVLVFITALFIALPRSEASLFGLKASAGRNVISVQELPKEAIVTLKAIRAGGPFAYERDGIIFGNYEKKLPPKRRGYYTEYTVKTPGVRNRGARRIVAGKGETGDPATSGEYWYSEDHYKSFRRIVK